MQPLPLESRRLAERFAAAGLDKLELTAEEDNAARSLQEAALNWIEFHTERKLITRELLETV